MRSMTSVVGVALFAVVAMAGTASAQTGQSFGEIVGRVVDQQDAALPGVTVTLSGPAVMGAQVAITNARGLYRFPAVDAVVIPRGLSSPAASPLPRG